MTQRTIILAGLGAAGVFVVAQIAKAHAAGVTGAASPVPPFKPSLLDTIVGDTQKGLAALPLVEGALGKLGFAGAVATVAPTLAAPVATIGVDAAAQAALPGAVAFTPEGLSTAAEGTLSETTTSGLGIGVASTIALIAIPLALFQIANVLGAACPQTPEVVAALQRAKDACGSNYIGDYETQFGTPNQIQKELSLWSEKPIALMVYKQNLAGGFGGMSAADFAAFLAKGNPTAPTAAYLRGLWCWANNPDGQYVRANLILNC